MGKRRIIAETGAGQHGVATATACALLDLECVVYMGTEDMRRQRPNVERMRLLGAEVVGVDAGARTLKEAVSAAIRDWVANVGDSHYIIGSCVGPAPYPALVRDLQRVIGDEARAQILGAGGTPARAGHRLRRRRLERDRDVRPAFLEDAAVQLIGVEAAGEGIETGRHGAPLTAGGAPGSCTARTRAVMQDEDGQILEAHSISAGLDYPGSGPEHAWLRDSGRARYVAVSDDEALAAFARDGAPRGDHPGARERPCARLDARRPRAASSTSSACRVAATRIWPRCSPAPVEATRRRSGVERIAEAFASARADGRRAALMPYMMAGYPDLETLDADRVGLRRRGRRPDRARDPVLGSARRRPRDPRRGGRRAARRRPRA